MVPPIENFSFNTLPQDVWTTAVILPNLGLDSIWALRLTSKEGKKVADQVLKFFWKSLSQNPPSGIVDIKGAIEQIETSALTTPTSKFKKLATKFFDKGVALKGSLPITAPQFIKLQTEAQDMDDALLSIWPVILQQIPTLPPLANPDNIRLWLNDPALSTQLNQITDLDLSDKNLKVLPPQIANLKKLEILDLTNNQLTTLPDSIGQLKALKTLILSDNKLSSLPDSIGQLKALKALYLDQNQLSSLPNTIGDLTNLLTLTLGKNKLSSLPDTIGALKHLQSLNVSENQFKQLPCSISNLIELRYLLLTDNQLSILPDTIGALKLLITLWCSNNQLSTLPSSIGELKKLQALVLSQNQLSSLPVEIGDLQTSVLRLDNNQLKTLPESLDKMTDGHLRTLQLDGNPFESIPNKLLNSQCHAISHNPTILAFKEAHKK
jgi:Leucine-rich repeat (LRR) protein